MNLLRRLFHRHYSEQKGYVGVCPAEKCRCGYVRPVDTHYDVGHPSVPGSPTLPILFEFSGRWWKDKGGFSVEGDTGMLEAMKRRGNAV